MGFRIQTAAARWWIGVSALALAAPLCVAALSTQDSDEAPIRYSETRPADSIARLQQRLDSGQLKLQFRGERGYLDSLLTALGISSNSQLLVFSKTSFQRDRISPFTPRALYFNDDTYVGYVQGGPVLELSTADPQLGGVFYILEQSPTRPKISRQRYECLSCHESGLTRGVPGHTVRSVYSMRDGQPAFSAGTFVTTPTSPYEERWGGWYLTGNTGNIKHLGNQMFGNSEEAAAPDKARSTNVPSVAPFCDTRPYLTPHSDVVAHMVMAHQVDIHNLMTRASYETKRALAYEALLNKELGRGSFRSESTTRRIQGVCEPLVKAILCADEAPLGSGITGSSSFSQTFAIRGPWDSKRRSLRELDLKTRLFRYPCSFLVYSDSFKGLPDEARSYCLGRLREILTGETSPAGYPSLRPEDRTAIHEILEETLPEYAAAPPRRRSAG